MIHAHPRARPGAVAQPQPRLAAPDPRGWLGNRGETDGPGNFRPPGGQCSPAKAVSDAPERGTATPGAARRRYLTMLFSDLSDSTQIAAAMEAEHYAELLGDLRRAYLDVIPKHGGTIVQIQGDGMLAIFGFPDARENVGREATEAALDLHQRVRSLRFDPALPGLESLSLHSGIHSGLVLFNEGDPVRGRFEMLGDATNVAKHLTDVAQNDEILVSEETLGPESFFFWTSERRYVNLKGRANPLAVLRILARAPVSTRFEASARRGLTPFVGRQHELGILERSLHEAVAGESRSLALAAGAGLGKTRLAEEFLRNAAALGCQIHRGYCESELSAEPLQPFLQMLRSMFRLDHGMSTTQAAAAIETRLSAINPDLQVHRDEVLGALSLGKFAEGAGSRKRPAAQNTIIALRDLFDGLAAMKPLVVFIDDWHCADDATHQVLDAIRGLDRRSILVLIATREFSARDTGINDDRVLELAPLSEDEAAQTIGRLLPRTDPIVVTKIQKHSGGNPLYIEELCHSAAYEDADHSLSTAKSGSAWLDILIESRVARLPEAQAELVRAAAVIGNVIPTWLLESITGCGEDDPLVKGLAAQDFVFPGDKAGTLRFKHGIARDVIYDSVGFHQRKALHLRIAQALLHRGSIAPGEDHCEALAYHFDAAGLADQAARYAEQAGDKAMAVSALDRAQAQYRAALAALDRSEPCAQLALRWNAISQRLGLACVFNPARSELPLFQRALALAESSGDAATIARATYWLGYIHYALGDARQAVQHSEQALIAAGRAGDDRLAVQVRATLGQAKAAAAQYVPALTLLDEAIAVKRAHRSGAGQAVGLAYSLASKGSVLGDRGQFTVALACFDEALEVVHGARHEVHASIHGLRAAVLLWQGQWDAARQSATEAFRIGEQVRSLFTLSMGRAAAAYARWMLESQPQALQDLQHATDWLLPRGITLFRSLNHGWLADGFASCGRRREARAHAAQALRRWREHDLIGGAMACRAMARVHAQEGDPKHAERWLARAREIAGCRDSAHEQAVNALCDAEIALDQRRDGRAAALLDVAVREFAVMGMSWHQAQAARLLQRL